jgi:energy-coupling factor transporter ATP-binding protein EcfA2
MKQRLGIAAALLGDPELVIVDEPTNGLDPAGIREMRQLIATIAEQDPTVIVSSHILSELEHVCDWLIVIDGGRLMYTGPAFRAEWTRLMQRRLLPWAYSGRARWAGGGTPMSPPVGRRHARRGRRACQPRQDRPTKRIGVNATRRRPSFPTSRAWRRSPTRT